ncbi:maleylpyruvate isomerase N-terminal domain-containing protein [Planomonospora algeriensis]
MDTGTAMTWLTAERLDLTDFLGGLDPDEWQADSLCPGWTVHDVAAGRAAGLAGLSGLGAEKIAATL